MEGLFDKLTDYVAYAHLWHSLEKTHSNDEVNYLMVRMFEIEEEVSLYFGLPLTFDYSDIFQVLGLKENFKLSDINDCIETLEIAAKAYFKMPVISDLELLKIAQESRAEIDNVLPELTLKLLAEPYYTFCYYFLFLKKTISAKEFLKELKTVCKEDSSIQLSNLAKKKLSDYKNDSDYKKLKKIGIQYLDVFLQHYDTFDNNRLEYLNDDLPF